MGKIKVLGQMLLTLVALPGNGGGAFRFSRVRPYLPTSIQWVPLTLPGFAERPRDPHLQTMRDYARVIHELIMPLSRPLIGLGTGIGGSFWLEYLQHYPETLDGVIFHAPVGARLDRRRFPWLMRLPGMRSLGQTLISAPVLRPWWTRRLFRDGSAIPSEYLDRFFAEYRQTEAFGQMFDILTAAWFNSLDPIDRPAALIWGEHERVLSVDHLADYQRLLPQAIIRRVADWDHFPMIEQPEAYARVIADLAYQLWTTARQNT
jgi:pimeloyl-ACP methyl ester carboxylesterase